MTTDTDNKFHPSFLPLLERIEETKMYSKYAFVEWETWEGHSHMILVGDGQVNSIALGATMEDMGLDLINAMQICNPDRHKDHGKSHNPAQFSDAFKAAMNQLMTMPFDAMYAHQVWLEAMHKKWGGHIPAAVLMPIDEQWSMIVPDHKGDPHTYEVREGILDFLPLDSPGNTEEAPIGKYYKLTPEQEKFRKMMRTLKEQGG
jgi:hypothetical protein|tara:strand:+ start:3513 stop:4121 length:609 start_codon:yes stop_codon:yes gene_type:complete